MARKKTEGKPAMPATPATEEKLRAVRLELSEQGHIEAAQEKLRAVRLELSEEEHAALRVEAARRDTSLMHLARVAVREFLARQPKK